MAKTAVIGNIYSYLVAPGKNGAAATPAIGTGIPLKGRMYDMLRDIFETAEEECRIPIHFVMDGDGKQKNPARDELIKLLKTPSVPNGLVLAKRLESVTTHKSGLGLLFFTLGKNENDEPKMVASRFPADQGVLADYGSSGLTVSFVEKVFMKNAHAYKAVVYQGDSYDRDFWDGAAVDRQINAAGSLADYWIKDFLLSDFKITPKTGTKQLAIALRTASAMVSDKKARTEIFAAAQLAKNLNGQVISVDGFADKFSLSKQTRHELVKNLPNEDLANVSFKFDADEFSKHVRYATVELDTGAVLAAPPGKFERCFTKKKVLDSDGEVEFSTKGKIVKERLKNMKP